MDELLKQMSVAELGLRTERAEIIRLLRDDKERQLLIIMLENNINSSRRLRSLMETHIARKLQTSNSHNDAWDLVKDDYQAPSEEKRCIYDEMEVM